MDLAGVVRGFANNGDTFSNVDFPGASGTQVFGVSDAGQMVGDTSTAPASMDSSTAAVPSRRSTSLEPQVPLPSRSWPAATSSEDVGIQLDSTAFYSRPASSPGSPFRSRLNDCVRHRRHREIAGSYRDATGNSHGFIYAAGAASAP